MVGLKGLTGETYSQITAPEKREIDKQKREIKNQSLHYIREGRIAVPFTLQPPGGVRKS